MARIKICKEPDCQDAATTGGYCRLHYLKHWSRIRQAEKRAALRRLNRYIEYVCKQNPEDYVEAIKKDLRSPQFANYVDDNFADEEGAVLFDEAEDEEAIDRIIKKLKVEEGF